MLISQERHFALPGVVVVRHNQFIVQGVYSLQIFRDDDKWIIIKVLFRELMSLSQKLAGLSLVLAIVNLLDFLSCCGRLLYSSL